MSDAKEFKPRCHLPIVAIFGLVSMGLVVGFIAGLGIRTTVYEDRTIARSYSEPEPVETQPATAEIESPTTQPAVAAIEPVESPSSVRQVNLQGR